MSKDEGTARAVAWRRRVYSHANEEMVWEYSNAPGFDSEPLYARLPAAAEGREDKYVAAVNGRKEFREAYRQERQRRMALEAELAELRELAPAHRVVVPVVTMSRIANCIVERVLAMTDWKRSQYKQLHDIIMQEFDKELG